MRNEDSVYLYVNDAWVNISGVSREDTIGRTIAQLRVIPREQAERFIAEDYTVRQQRRLVKIDTFNVQGSPTRFMSVRVLLERDSTSYIVEVLFVLSPLVTESVTGWSSRRLEYIFGEDLARSLLGIQEQNEEETGVPSNVDVDTIVWNLYTRIVSDPDLASYFVNVDVVEVVSHQMVMLSSLIKGTPPPQYDLEEIHADLHITNEAFNKVLHHVFETFLYYNVPPSEVARVMTSLESFRDQIVTAEDS